MAKVLSFNHVDTPISGVTTNPVPVGLVNFGADFRVERQTADEVVMTNMRSPLGDPEKFRHAFSVVNNVYSGTPIEPALRSQNVKGVRLLIQHTDIASVTDSGDATFMAKLPFKVNITLEIPANEYVTATNAKDFLLRTIAGAFETGSNTAARLEAELRGSMLPADLK